MQFPDRDAMTAEQAKNNAEAAKVLQKGKYYRFSPAAKAGAVPTGGPSVCSIMDCTFDRGWYVGFVDGNHMFQGKPINDVRRIDERLRESYFAVLFINGGVVACVDSDQSHHK